MLGAARSHPEKESPGPLYPSQCFADRRSRSYIPGNRVAVVCSARSTQTKALGTTNLLLQASREALQPVSARGPNGAASGDETPLYPKRVGSGYFSASVLSSLSSLKDGADALRERNTERFAEPTRSASPSPFTPSSNARSRSPTGPDSGPDTPLGGSEVYDPAFNATVDTIKAGHLDAARQALRAGPLRVELCEEIERDCEALRSFLNAASVSATKPTVGLSIADIFFRSSTRSRHGPRTRSLALASAWRVRSSLPHCGIA